MDWIIGNTILTSQGGIVLQKPFCLKEDTDFVYLCLRRENGEEILGVYNARNCNPDTIARDYRDAIRKVLESYGETNAI